MPQLDSLLRIVDQQGANELRLGSDKAPSMYASGTPKKLTIPATSTSTLRELFGEILNETRLAQLDRLGRIEVAHEAQGAGRFRITITKRPGGELAFDAIVLRATAAQEAAPAAAAPAAAALPVAAPIAASSAAAPAPIAHAPLAAHAPIAHSPILQSHAPAIASTAPYRLAPTLAAALAQAVTMGASDVHLSETDPPTARLHGRLVPLNVAIASLPDALVETFGEATLTQITTERVSADFSIDLGTPTGNARARVNAYRTARGLAAAFRLLPSRIPMLGELGFPIPLDDLATLPNGLVLITGATGSGKSTTVASLVREILARRSVLLITLEDPIEYVFEGTSHALVRQRQIGRDVRDFPTGLRDALREDPDVLLVGEMRDAESIQLALTAAETGHLVLASLHARSAATAAERIIDTYPGDKQPQIRVMLADSLRAIVSQRLLPREGGSGRALAAEILRSTAAASNAIREGKLGSLRSLMQAGRADGMISLERCLADLVRRKQISLETARAATNDPAVLTQYLDDRGGPRG
ncbi:MAG: PilT/PilU family type 4a pilus ATPase [Polyangiaceae bacterium]